MFEFFAFQPGGLILYPSDAEQTLKSTHVVSEYVKKVLLEGHVSDSYYVKDKFAVLCQYDPEVDLHFAITVHQQVAQQISYFREMVNDFQTTFSDEFEELLSNKSITLLPSMFTDYSSERVIAKYRDYQTKQKVEQPEPEVEVAPKVESDPIKLPNKKSSRPRFTHSSSTSNIDSISTVIRSEQEDEAIEIKKVDLDNFQSFVKPVNDSSFSSLFKSIVGEKLLTSEVLDPILQNFEHHLIAKNVSAQIAAELTAAVGQKLNGTKCTNFTSVKNIVVDSMKSAIERILTPHRNLDIIRDIQNAKARGQPYVMAFIGVNGVGKSTSLSKVAYFFKSLNFKVLMAACDTYRSGAIDQLGYHCRKLDVALYERGGKSRDPVPVAKQAIAYGKENGFDVVLIDTAGRMQTSDSLMKQIARLINEVKPDMTLFVAEALVGTDGSDQITAFDETLRRHSADSSRGIDGIVLTKFDTIDDKVGAAITLVYKTGHPIVFLGVGQHYRDLRRMQPEFVVSALLDGL